MKRRGTCRNCQQDRRIYGRGICESCWRDAKRTGQLDRWGDGRGHHPASRAGLSRSGRGPQDWDDIDEVAVERILSGDWRMRCTKGEKREVCFRWARWGRSMRELEHLTGWNTSRYYRIGDAERSKKEAA